MHLLRRAVWRRRPTDKLPAVQRHSACAPAEHVERTRSVQSSSLECTTDVPIAWSQELVGCGEDCGCGKKHARETTKICWEKVKFESHVRLTKVLHIVTFARRHEYSLFCTLFSRAHRIVWTWVVYSAREIYCNDAEAVRSVALQVLILC